MFLWKLNIMQYTLSIDMLFSEADLISVYSLQKPGESDLLNDIKCSIQLKMIPSESSVFNNWCHSVCIHRGKVKFQLQFQSSIMFCKIYSNNKTE